MSFLCVWSFTVETKPFECDHIPAYWNKLKFPFDVLHSLAMHRRGNEGSFPLQALHNTHFTLWIWTFFTKNLNDDVCDWWTNAAVFPHNCTFLHFSAKYLLLNMLPLSSEVRAMQGLKVMPGSMALDKDLVKAEQDMHQTTSAAIFNNSVNHKISVKRPTVAQIPIFITQMHLKDTANVSVIRKSKRKKKKKKHFLQNIYRKTGYAQHVQ